MARKKVFGIAGSNKEVFGIAGSNKEVFGITDLGEKVPIGTTTVAIQAGTKLIIGSTSDSITPGTKIEIGSIVNPQDLSSLTIMGEWENPQFINNNVDTTGIVVAANYGEYFSRLVEPTLSRNTWGDTPGEQSITFSYTEGGITVSATATVNINKKLTGLTVSGDWVTQFYNNPVDTTGLSFIANYEYGSPKSITPDTISPSVWGGTGSQFATFSYSENGITVSASKEASVVKKLTGLIIGGDWVKAQFVNNIINTTGLSFAASYNDGSGDFVSPSVTPITWGSTVGTQTATFTYGENGIAVSASKDANVVRKLISLNVYGSWSNPQYTNTAVDTTGLIFTANYEDGFTASISPSVSPSSWSSTAGTQTATFSYSENGVTVSATKDASVVVQWNGKPVGGIIFYINSSSSNTYKFHNANGVEVSAPTVGTDCTDWTYEVTGATKDKFYVYYPTLVTSKYWGYYGITTSATGNSMGAGKTNTSTVLAITDTSSYASDSIWEYIRNMRTNKTNGCDDWFVGCPDEYDKLRSSGTTGVSWFSSNSLWPSREYNNDFVYTWDRSSSKWDWTSKYWKRALIPLRAF